MHIVVLAYGPSQLTKRAVNRARRLAGGSSIVTSVAVSPAGLKPLPDPATIGTAGIRNALATIPNEPTLIIHDDTVITTRGAMALQRAMDEGNRIVVPYTNDPDTDHFVGPLPTTKAAERDLDQIKAPNESRQATVVRAGCIAGRRDDLLTLLAEPIADPHSTIRSEHYGIVVAAGAIASHSSDCLQAMVTEDLDERPLLVAALIVKNEERLLPECLDSLNKICDRIEVCDTGSTDNTIAIAKAAGANVIEKPWPDDFGKARNYVLDRCRDARYTIVIDADERVHCQDPDKARKFMATYSGVHQAFNVNVSNLDEDGSEMYSILSVRIFQSTHTEYRGALHETVHLKDADAPLAGNVFDYITVEHHGYSQEVVAERDKYNRNLALAEAQHENDDDARSAVHLARSLSYAGEDPTRALELLEKSLDALDNSPKTTRAQILILMADRCLVLGDAQRTFDLASEGLELMPGDDPAVGLLATATEHLGNYEEFITVAESVNRTNATSAAVRVDHNRMIYRNHLVAAYAKTGRTEQAVEGAFEILTDHPEEFHMWAVLIEALNSALGDSAIELLAPLAAKDPTGGFLEPLIRTYPTAQTAEFCAKYASSGGLIPEAVRVGLLAATMSGNDKTFSTLSRSVHLLNPSTIAALSERITGHGRRDLAAMLTAPVGASR